MFLRSKVLPQVFIAALAASLPLGAQSSAPPESPAFTFDEHVEGSVNSLGAVTRVDTSAGYVFNRHWSADLGVPFYFVSPSSSTAASTGVTSFQALGNVYAQMRLTLANPAVNYVSTLTGAAPTGDRTDGLSTGHAILDWTNYFDHSFGRLTPFAEIGI